MGLTCGADSCTLCGSRSGDKVSTQPTAHVPAAQQPLLPGPGPRVEFTMSPSSVVSDPSPSSDVSELRELDVEGPFEAVPELLRPALERRGFKELTSVQRAVLGAELEGRDLQISSQTGSGKTVALGFVLARAIQGQPEGKGPQALIIVPTRELAAQVCTELQWLLADVPGVSLASVTGGTPLHRDRKILSGGTRVLVGTPGRLLDHVSSGVLDLSGVDQLVLDEADQMLDMGFRDELEGILEATPPTRRTHLVSATFPPGIQDLARRYQSDPAMIEGTPLGDVNQDIQHEGFLIQKKDRYALLLNLLLLRKDERTLVFVERRADALTVAERLEADGFTALPLSGELAQSQRDRTLAAFKDGRAKVLVATDVAARGIDVSDVAAVIQTAPPVDAQVYVHRSGRTGRAGKTGRSFLFAPANRRRKVERLLREAGVDLTWSKPPTAAEVEEKLAHRASEARRTKLEAALSGGVSPEGVEEASRLLEGRQPEDVVAALLAMLEPGGQARARDVGAHDSGEGAGRRDDGPGRDRPRGFRQHRDRSGSPRQGRGGGDSVRFFINYGYNQGATPGRLLAAICRRGEVQGSDIGSIAIHPNASTFDVHMGVAEHFERRAGRRDARDPHSFIRRDRGPRGNGR